MEEVMMSGRGVSSSLPLMHLLILTSLRPAATAGTTFIDAGCGTGYLLAAWLKMAGANSRVIGLELDEKTARDARLRLAESDAVGDGQIWPEGAQATITVADALEPDVSALAKLLAVEEGSVEMINVGLAVEEPPPALVKLLCVGGLMTLPLIDEEQSSEGTAADVADSTFYVLSKAADGTLSPVDGSPSVAMLFTRGVHARCAKTENSERRAQLLRFRIGDEVDCATGPDRWVSGRVIALLYRDGTMPPELVAPYQVRLDGDHAAIYVPEDCDEVVRRSTTEREAIRCDVPRATRSLWCSPCASGRRRRASA